MQKRVPHASHWGSYELLVEDGAITAVEPFADDPFPSPIIHSVTQWATSPLRIQTPLVRKSWLADRHASDRRLRGHEDFVAVSWDEALDLVASEITRVAQDHGNDSIFAGSYGWTSCGRFHHAPTQLKRMLNLVGGFTGHVDTYSIAAGPVILRHILGTDGACVGYANTLDTVVEHTQTLVVFGGISPRSAQTEAGGIGTHGLEAHLREIAARGIRVILISPNREDLPEWMPCDWWPIRPNSDTALIMGLAGEILRAGRHDLEFLKRYTSGHEALLDYLAGKTDGIEKNARWAASITGIGPGRIAALARAMVDTRSMITMSWSLQRAHHGEQPYWAAVSLAAMIGQMGQPGGGVGFGYGSLGGVGVHLTAGVSPSLPVGKKPNDSFIPVARISDMLLNPGAPFTYEGQSRSYPDIKLVYWAGGNPFHHHQDLNRLNAAWQRPETIIVQDPMFTATARRADIILPATSSLERNDLGGNRRSDMIVAMKKAIEPVGQSRSDYDIFNALAAKLGVAEAFNEGRDEMAWIRHLYETMRAQNAQLGHTMPDFDSFWAAGHVPAPVKTTNIHLEEFIATPEAAPLDTESGKIVLGSSLLTGLGLPDCPPHASWLEPQEWLGRASADELHLISNQPQGRLHSQLDQGPASMEDKENGRERARIHPIEAWRRGISTGQLVRLSNPRGQCYAQALVTETVAPGCVILPTGAWLTLDAEGKDLSGNPNVLTLDIGTSGFANGCSAHSALVRIEPAEEAAPDPQATYQMQLNALLPG